MSQPSTKTTDKKPSTRLVILEDRRLIEKVKVLQTNIFPVKYSDTFYNDLFQQPHHMNQILYFNDVLVGIVCCRLELASETPGTPTTTLFTPDSATPPPPVRCYIMTLGVLKPYRRLGLAHTLLETALTALQKYVEKLNLTLTEVALHVQVSNAEGLGFYKKEGFTIGPVIPGYYKLLDIADAHLVTKKI
eukprot:PhF_6_TR21897/c0_g1_i2/m.31094/K20793/NAA50, NAT5; N-alpha-acetyltransferase 50